MRALAAAAALVLVPAAAHAAATARPAPARRAPPPPSVSRDWSRVAALTPAGAILIGNPAAKVKLVEYLSLTCPHCAHFAADGMPPLLASYVKPGLVSIEVRHAIRDGLDLVATLLARCGGPARWEPLSRAMFGSQVSWIVRAAAEPTPDGADVAGQMKAAAQNSGLEGIVAKQGIGQARAEACLASKPEQDRLVAMQTEAWEQRHIPGTPAFFLNGQPIGANSWDAIEPAIRAALK